MGEVVVSSFEEMEVENVEKDNSDVKMIEEIKEGSSSMVRWENFLPRSGIRVLLVEADDSTRQIIGALLRKCSYKVATAPDGLKAWEVLKARPHSIDLILTEMELPAISGYALLTLIMEHEICKNIPVILMSTHDSVSMVYKCMMRGAADFLVKPIRINELKNLWQHVWRRQSQLSKVGHNPQDETAAEEKLEATAENNAVSDHSSGSKARAPRQEECTKKGSDAQSSCGKVDIKDDSAYTAEVDDNLRPKQGLSPLTGLTAHEIPNRRHSGPNLCTPESAAGGSDTAAYDGSSAFDQEGRIEQQTNAENLDLCTQSSSTKKTLANFSRQAIDLIGAFDNQPKRSSCQIDGVNKCDSSPQLDLSLRRCFPDALGNKSCSDKQMLNHSNASAFTRYVNKGLYASDSNATSASVPKENKLGSADYVFNYAPESNSSEKDILRPYDRKFISLPVSVTTTEAETESRNVRQKMFPIPLPLGGVRVDVRATPAGYGSSVPPNVCSSSPSPSPSSANQQLNSYQQFSVDVISSRQQFHSLEHSQKISSNQSVRMQDQKLEPLDDRTHFFSAADPSASSSLCNDNASHLNSSEGGNGLSHVTHDLSRQRSIQRELALNKFRLKRKERCYDKKVRYESRKKLAEQRPRVKGQFVRQVPPDPPPTRSDNSGGG